MTLIIDYKFIPQGKSYEPTDREVVLDVGGLNEGLIFDHHFVGAKEEKCASLLVFEDYGNRLNALNSKKSVTIVIHEDPDFDCSCAAWLVKNYLEKGEFPAGAEWVVNYAGAADSGNLSVEQSHYLVPISAMYSLSELVDQNREKEDKNKCIVKKACELMDWCAENLADIEEINQESSKFKIFDKMIESLLFEEENELLKNDLELFNKELKDATFVSKTKYMRLFRKVTWEKEDVPALIYLKPPQSVLTKHWARNEGYIATIIPITCDNRWNSAKWKTSEFLAEPNRVKISVPPEALYNLKPVAQQLERAECEIENVLLGSKANLKRRQTTKRRTYENERWVTNNDPWYDGVSHNYTIVDSPGSYSLLSIDEIISIALNNTEPDIFRLRINIIYPLHLKVNENSTSTDQSFNWEDILNNTNSENPLKAKVWESFSKDNRFKDYFFTYVNNFLYAKNKEGETDKWFERKNDQNAQICDLPRNNIDFKVNDSQVVCFDAELGFAVLSLDFWNIMSNDVSDILTNLRCKCKNIFSEYVTNSEMLEHYEPVYMTLIIFNGFKDESFNIETETFGACSFRDTTLSLMSDSSSKNWKRKMLLKINAGNIFCFSRDCMTFASTCLKKENKQENSQLKPNCSTFSTFLDDYWKKFNEPWINEWIMILYQYYGIILMKERMGQISMTDKSEIELLKSKFVKFKANSFFVQVTSDPTGAEIYNRLKELFALKSIYSEMDSQIVALSDDINSYITNLLTMVSFFVLPMTLSISILQLFFTSGDNIQKYFLFLIVSGLCVTFYNYHHEKRGHGWRDN